MRKTRYSIRYKYENAPWKEWEWTIVPSMVDHYLQLAQREHPNALVKVFEER